MDLETETDEPGRPLGRGAARDADEGDELGSLYLTAAQAKALLRLVETASKVNRKSQFFIWLQSQVDALLPHVLAVCGAYHRGRRQVHYEVFNSIQVPQNLLDSLAGTDSQLMAELSRDWIEGSGRPFLISTGELAQRDCGPESSGLIALGVSRLVVHGVARPERAHEIETLFLFGGVGDGPDNGQLQTLGLVMPHLHATYLRMQGIEREVGAMAPRASGRSPDRSTATLTARELQILHWVREGMTNQEVGAQLGISAWTVKNHVQKILQRLGASNRAHAVSIAIKARLLPESESGRGDEG